MNTKSLKDSIILSIFSYLAIIVEVGLVIYMLQIPNANFEFIVGFHSFILIWSIVYHLLPGIRTNFLYSFFAQTFSTLFLIASILNLIVIVMLNDWSVILYLEFFIYFIGPAGLTSFALLLMINFNLWNESCIEIFKTLEINSTKLFSN